MRTVARRVVVPLLASLALHGCGRAAAPEAPVVSAAQFDQQAIAAATARERAYQAAIAKGDLPFLGDCTRERDTIRLVDVGSMQGYSLAVVADAHGAVAIWQGLQHTGDGRYAAFGPHGMRLDGNGWRQLRQALVEPDFTAHAEPVAQPVQVQRRYPDTFIAYCVDGQPFLEAEPAAADERFAFERTAVAMRRLAGNYYSPPARSGE